MWDGDWAILEEYDQNGNRVQGYVQGYHGLVKTLVDNIYYYQDELGSTSHIADAGGTLLEYYKYDLYGKPRFFSPSNQELITSNYSVADLGDGGARWIPQLLLYDDRNRFMSPDLGRFLQPDPIGFKGDSSNLYRYVGNDWANKTDRLGLQEGGEEPPGRIEEEINPEEARRETAEREARQNLREDTKAERQQRERFDRMFPEISRADTIRSLQREIRSLQKRIEEHQRKLEEYKKDPFKHDNKNFLRDAKDNPARQQKIIEARERKIENNIKTWQKTIEYDKQEVQKLQAAQVEPKASQQTVGDMLKAPTLEQSNQEERR